MRIPGSMSVPRGILESACEWEYEETIPALVQAREREVVVVCRSGYRSVLAAHSMQVLGYQNVVSLKTGLRGWKDYEQPLVDQAGDGRRPGRGRCVLSRRECATTRCGRAFDRRPRAGQSPGSWMGAFGPGWRGRGRHVPDAVDEVAPCPRGNFLDHRLTQVAIAGVDLDLDELVVGQGAIDLRDDAVGEPGMAEQDHWLEVMDLALEPAALLFGDGHGSGLADGLRGMVEGDDRHPLARCRTQASRGLRGGRAGRSPPWGPASTWVRLSGRPQTRTLRRCC